MRWRCVRCYVRLSGFLSAGSVAVLVAPSRNSHMVFEYGENVSAPVAAIVLRLKLTISSTG